MSGPAIHPEEGCCCGLLEDRSRRRGFRLGSGVLLGLVGQWDKPLIWVFQFGGPVSPETAVADGVVTESDLGQL